MSDPSMAKLEADIAARRARLADTLSELSYRSQPKVIAERQKRKAQVRFADATQNQDGSVRVEVVAPLALAAVLLIAWGVRRSGRR